MPHDANDPTPSTPTTLSLGDSILRLPNLPEQQAHALQRLGLWTIANLIKHLPYRYEFHTGQTQINQLMVESIATTQGLVASCRWIPKFGSPIGRSRGGRQGRFTVTIEDETGRLELIWFNAGYLRHKIEPGTCLTVTGKIATYQDRLQMANPNFQITEPSELLTPTDPTANTPAPSTTDMSDHEDIERPLVATTTDRYHPIYHATELASSQQIERLIRSLPSELFDQIDDHFDEAYRQRRDLPTLRQSYLTLHHPIDADAVKHARRRLAYDELILLQLGFALKRKQIELEQTSPSLRWSEAIDRHIRDRFPFDLTDSQNRVIEQIRRDLTQTTPMNRLLQGDVGSGKTIVALYALLMAAASNKQGILMAPTEILAEQHYHSISEALSGAQIKIGLLTGSLTTTQRQHLLYQIERGELDIIVGTHALLNPSIKYHDLALTIIDEQHRFGVNQRAALRDPAPGTPGTSPAPAPGSTTSSDQSAASPKLFATPDDSSDDASDAPSTTPHNLVMTATPIPRTLSLTLFGDLDISTIDQLPPGRKPIITEVHHPDKADALYQTLAEQLAQGEQAYIVVPAIDETDSGLKAVRSHADELQKKYFKDLKVATLHGQLKQVTRQRLMHQFRQGQFDVLIATTVIEVGVDVPNATIMVIEQADRFGLAQLHQLRGRVGRGQRPSRCYLITDPTTDNGQQRIDAIAKTTDGFAIAEADLKIRGMGELVGTKQAGLPPMRIAQLPRHLDLLQLARRDAHALIEQDPRLSTDAHDLLRKRLIKQYGQALGLADVG